MLRWKLSKAVHQLIDEAQNPTSGKNSSTSNRTRPKYDRSHGNPYNETAISREPAFPSKVPNSFQHDRNFSDAEHELLNLEPSDRLKPRHKSSSPPPYLGLGMRIAGDSRVLCAPNLPDGPRAGDELLEPDANTKNAATPGDAADSGGGAAPRSRSVAALISALWRGGDEPLPLVVRRGGGVLRVQLPRRPATPPLAAGQWERGARDAAGDDSLRAAVRGPHAAGSPGKQRGRLLPVGRSESWRGDVPPLLLAPERSLRGGDDAGGGGGDGGDGGDGGGGTIAAQGQRVALGRRPDPLPAAAEGAAAGGGRASVLSRNSTALGMRDEPRHGDPDAAPAPERWGPAERERDSEGERGREKKRE